MHKTDKKFRKSVTWKHLDYSRELPVYRLHHNRLIQPVLHHFGCVFGIITASFSHFASLTIETVTFGLTLTFLIVIVERLF